ncbi:hypothetical protein RB653_006022 [Dictyostelium firmibasis]|uniref:Large ribosomal subunit protein bL28m n=1 Tax=Dictyostelium firmibasis TaxID=79012 RepID=A0AAN7UAM3_9MYCE
MSFFNSLTGLACRSVMKRAQRGLYGGKDIIFGDQTSFSNRKTRRTWKPNVQTKTYHSDVLDTNIRVSLTTYTIRCIDKAGSFDNYIIHTKDKDLASELGSDLKLAMQYELRKKALLILEEEQKVLSELASQKPVENQQQQI